MIADWALDQLAVLAQATGLLAQQLTASTLRPIAESMLGVGRLRVGIWPWFLVLGYRNRLHAGGLQCCPDCIEQPMPHYSIQARLAWHTGCPLHSVQLIDQCHHCLAPLQPERLRPGGELSQCHHCGKSLCSCPRELLSAPALAFQSFADECYGRSVAFGQVELNFSEWMKVARALIGFLQMAARYCSGEAARFFQALGIDVATLHSSSTGLPFECLRPAERAELLGNVWMIMRAGPDRFMALAKQASLPASWLSPSAQEAPAVLISMASALTVHSRGTPMRRGYEPPRSPHQVLRMWFRLHRRMRRDGIE
ncbi:hypothetical protein Q3H58_003519 [Pseudomonas psychrotolerans]|nr:hypothetical protein [Pseudomonas psychrotolerans]